MGTQQVHRRGNANRPGGSCRWPHTRTQKKPTVSQTTRERAEALQAVVALVQDRAVVSTEETGATGDSVGNDSDTSLGSGDRMPEVTPQTADGII